MPQNIGVGIDVSKNTLDVCIITRDKNIHQKFSNTEGGIRRITELLKKQEVESSQIVLESTGDYHMLCAYRLFNRYNVKIINPLISKHYMQTTVRKLKTDKVDAYHLATLSKSQVLNSHRFSIEELEKKKIVVMVDTLEKHISALKLSMNNIQDTFTKFGIESDEVMCISKQIKLLAKELNKLHDRLYTLVNKQEVVDSLSEVSGISKATATKVIALIEDRTFDTKGCLVAFAGLDVAVKESGLYKGKVRISKRGSSQLRKYLIQIAWGLFMHNENFKKYAESYKDERKYYEILVIIARKFLRMLYGAMKNNNNFMTEYLTTV